MLRADSSILVVVDMQEAFRTMQGFSAVVPRAVQIVHSARLLDIPVVGTELTPSRMGTTIEELSGYIDRRAFHAKESFSSLQVPAIAEAIAASRAHSVVLMGCEVHLAVLQTALQTMATFDCHVHLVVDCSASRRERDRELGLERMRRAGVQLTSVEMVLFEWLRDTRHPRFGAVTQKPGSSASSTSSVGSVSSSEASLP
jgi:nicotinamidase-related amidase